MSICSPYFLGMYLPGLPTVYVYIVSSNEGLHQGLADSSLMSYKLHMPNKWLLGKCIISK